MCSPVCMCAHTWRLWVSIWFFYSPPFLVLQLNLELTKWPARSRDPPGSGHTQPCWAFFHGCSRSGPRSSSLQWEQVSDRAISSTQRKRKSFLMGEDTWMGEWMDEIGLYKTGWLEALWLSSWHQSQQFLASMGWNAPSFLLGSSATGNVSYGWTLFCRNAMALTKHAKPTQA